MCVQQTMHYIYFLPMLIKATIAEITVCCNKPNTGQKKKKKKEKKKH